MLRLNTCLGALKEKSFETFVFKGADHTVSVTRNAPRYKMPNVLFSRRPVGCNRWLGMTSHMREVRVVRHLP